jgi:acyl-homoserine-lactone acylase
MIARRLAGTHGLGRPGFTLSTLQATILGNRNFSAELGRADVVPMCRAHPVLTAGDGTAVDVRAACDTFASWDGRADVDSREELWETFFDDSLWKVPFDPAHPLTAPRGIDGNDPEVQRAFADAVQSLRSDDSLRSDREWAGIALHGCPDEKAASTSSRSRVAACGWCGHDPAKRGRRRARDPGALAASDPHPPSMARASSWPSS